MVARIAVVALLLAIVAGIGACFTLSFANGSIACSSDPTRQCPAGYSCVNDRCYVTSSIPNSDGGDGAVTVIFDGGSD